MGLKVKQFLLGMVSAFLFIGCAGFSYRYYGLEDVDYSRGKMLADKAENDLPFSKCEPSSSSKHPCVILFATEFYKLKQDLIDTQNKLKQCEGNIVQALK